MSATLKAIWIGIPAKDLERAMRFYQTVFDLPATEIIADAVRRITILPTAEGAANVSLNQTNGFEPSKAVCRISRLRAI